MLIRITIAIINIIIIIFKIALNITYTYQFIYVSQRNCYDAVFVTCVVPLRRGFLTRTLYVTRVN